MGLFDRFFGRHEPSQAPRPASDDVFSRSSSAAAAKDRLKIVIAEERADIRRAEFMPKLHQDLLEVIRKYFEIDEERMNLRLQKDEGRQVLELNVELPPPGANDRRLRNLAAATA